ncbi:hypothetical protein EZV62_012227 [Acer yangbiense]|uniref:50S ribosomal protein L35 n=1 Tax=Acer yangbiense TaxID=1000413 RepID=A0A5C7HVN2_9ROSI|nr:hypothetical protein EZV62_012227 [Acer yangbiense]
MASTITTLSFNLRFSQLRPSSSSSSSSLATIRTQLAPFNKVRNSLRLSSTHSISGFLFPLNKPSSTLTPPPSKSLTVFAAKGYKMKTHKASAKRFRVTGRGKIVRRRAGKQHLLAKKNNKRKLRLSKMNADIQDRFLRDNVHVTVIELFRLSLPHEVSRSDYDNVIGALPYLKVNRLAK